MKRLVVLLLICTLAGAAASGAKPAKKKRPAFDAALPMLGTKLRMLPAGAGKEATEQSCLPCHSADILVQQRLTEKQWTATVDKMIRWGAVVDEKQKGEMIAYLAKHFGPENRYTPTMTRPVGF